MRSIFHLKKEDDSDIGFAITCLIFGVVTFSEFKNWLYYVIEHSDEVPSYFFDVMDLEEKFDFTLKISEYLGFWPAWGASDQEIESLQGIGFMRFPGFRSDSSQKQIALRALAENPHVETLFRETFPFIEW